VNQKPRPNFFDRWNDTEKVDEDFTTENILAEKETFDLLAERGYETLEDYSKKEERKV